MNMMKRTFTLLFSLIVGFNASSQYFSDEWPADVLTGTNAWTTNTTNPSFFWDTDDAGSAGNFYAVMTNFAAGYNAVEAWLVTPAIDLSTATAPVLNFRNAYNFAGDALELFICTDYTGGDPASDGSWTDHTTDVTWSAGGFAWTNSGNVDLSGYLSATVFIAFKYTGTASDGSKWQIDNIVVDEAGAVGGEIPISEIQYSTASPAESPELGNVVTTRGLVTGIVLNGPDSAAYFMQDGDTAWSGIYVYDIDAVVSIGDSVLVEGEVDEFNLGSAPDGVTEIKNVTSYTVLSSGNPLPTPVDVTTSDANNEEWEGVLINVVSGECTNNTEGFGLWSIDDGSGVIKGDDDIYAYHLTAIVGNWYQVTGIGHYSFDEAKILPRYIADISTTGYAGISENEASVLVYPNPASDVFHLSINAEQIELFSLTGERLIQTSGSSVDVSELATGMYQLIIRDGNTVSSQRLIIQ